MFRCHSQPWYVLPIVAIGLFIYWFMPDHGSAPTTDRDAMIGTWTDENGEPGNSVRFYSVPIDLPGSPIVTGMEGHLTLINFLGEKEAQGVWNYGYWDPLVVNIIVGKTCWYAAIRKLADDHILIRFGRDPNEMMQPGAIDHPKTMKLKRISRE